VDAADPAGRGLALIGLALGTRQRAGARLLGELESRYGRIETWWRDRRARLGGDPRFAPLVADLDVQAAAMLDQAACAGFRVVEPWSLPRILALPDPPVFLFQRGEPASSGPALAVVGARRASAYGLRTTSMLVEGLARRGVTILSGLARGVDARAHQAALAAGGATVAVLGCGPDRVYPAEHRRLQDRIGREGALITEYLPGTPPKPEHFPRRNRILVALSDAVLVVEARRKSGTLTSVGWAADLGREVLVVPGPIDSELAEGPTDLLREGATPIGSVAHVLEALGLDPEPGVPGLATRAPALGEPESRLVALLEGGALDLDDLVRMSGDPPSRVLTIVLSLETRGIIARESDGRSFRRASPFTTAAGATP
jgi:DNA processing protein